MLMSCWSEFFYSLNILAMLVSVSFANYLLIPAPDRFQGNLPLWLFANKVTGRLPDDDRVVRRSETVVLFLNCASVEEILPLLDRQIDLFKVFLEKIDRDETFAHQVEHNLSVFSQLRKMVAEGSPWVKDAPEGLLSFLARDLGPLKRDQVLFLSMISSFEEV